MDEFYDMQSWHEYLIAITLHYYSHVTCVDAPLTSTTLVAEPSVPYIDESLIYVHDHTSSEPLT